ncbi:MAG TPA: NAD-dependent epimerase/dehydratase family protein [Acidimicrobiia bacterium]
MSVAVTGGSGVVGSAVVRHLVDGGEEVWALARSAESSHDLSELGARVVTGDLFDRDALARLVKGRSRVFHIAGVNEMCSRDPERMWRVNVEGSNRVVAACIDAGVERLVHTSSAVAIGEPEGTMGTERSPHRGEFLSEYERSKTVAERMVLDRAAEIDVVFVNPSSVQGPGRSTGTGAIFLAIARGDLPFLVDTTISLVDIDDCARGHLLAAEKGLRGERYLLSGPVLTIRQAVSMLRRKTGRRSSPRFLHPGVVTAVAPVVGAVAHLVGVQPPLCPESARVLLHGHQYDGSRATRELGLEYTSLEETLDRTLAWFDAEGLLD